MTTAVLRANHATLGTGIGVLTGRALHIYVRTPQVVLLRVIQSVVFLLIFRYVFGGAISTGGLRYVDFMAPGLIVISVMFATIGTALGVAEDLATGLYDRLRSLPMPRAAVLVSRVVADLLVTIAVLLPTVALAFAVGMRVHNGWLAALAALGLCVLYGLAFVCVFVAIGLVAGSVQAAQGISFIVMPLSFASSAFVPTASMPGWLQAFTANQPVTQVVNAVRVLAEGNAAVAVLGHDARYYVTRALIWVLGIIIVFGLLAMARYRSR